MRRRSFIFVVLLATASTLGARSRRACDRTDHSGQEFDDVASLTVLSSAAFDGRPVRDGSDHDVVQFRVGHVYKGAELLPEGVQTSSTQSEPAAVVQLAVRLSSKRCARSIRRRRRRFLLFLNGSQADSDDQRPAIYRSTSAPVRFSKRNVRIVKQHSCSDCGKSFVVDLHCIHCERK